jgi:hypothetical protein
VGTCRGHMSFSIWSSSCVEMQWLFLYIYLFIQFAYSPAPNYVRDSSLFDVHLRRYTSWINPSHYISWIDPSHYISWIDPSHYTSWINPSHHISWINPSHYISWIDPSHYISWINPSHHISWINPSGWGRLAKTKMRSSIYGLSWCVRLWASIPTVKSTLPRGSIYVWSSWCVGMQWLPYGAPDV